MIRLQQVSHALGSTASLTLVVKDESTAKSLFQALWAQIRAFEERFSRFQPDSELSHFNAQAGQPVKISPQFQALLATCQRLAKATGGLFNPLTLPALQRAGYIGSWPQPDKFDQALNYSQRQAVVNIDALQIADDSAQIPAEAALDFGGLGKGYLLDQLADSLDTSHVKNYWLSLGGDLICQGYDHQKQPWQLGIAKADEPEALAATFTNHGGAKLALATSGVTKRKGLGWHHLIDPRTGQSAVTDLLTATVIATNATEADVFAKCLIIAGSQAAGEFIKVHKITAALLQAQHHGRIKLIKYRDLA